MGELTLGERCSYGVRHCLRGHGRRGEASGRGRCKGKKAEMQRDSSTVPCNSIAHEVGVEEGGMRWTSWCRERVKGMYPKAYGCSRDEARPQL